VRELLEDPAEQVNFLVGGSEGDRFTLKRGANHSLTGFSREDLVVPELERYYGLFVIGEMLRQRMGDEPFFSAMDEVFRVNRGGTATTEDFLAAWQSRSGSDLGPFFDFWVHGGLVPEITLNHATRPTDEGLEWVGCLESDIPFGTFQVPIRVEEGEQVHDQWAEIAGGQGKIVLSVQTDDVTASVDPEGQILAYKRKSKAVKELSCTGD
jgi:aminopeptidase N